VRQTIIQVHRSYKKCYISIFINLDYLKDPVNPLNILTEQRFETHVTFILFELNFNEVPKENMKLLILVVTKQ